ncbi:MAG TPA: hypothetical protein VFT47_16060 [Vicinamibacterales bacterium]|nr:hypothetical protein [Vicinamibacterales bacterium]
MRIGAVSSRTRTATLVILAGALTACAPPQTALTQLLDARRVASEIHVQFTQAADASNRAVMADTDPVAAAAADEARKARGALERNVDTLRSLLQSLGYGDDLRTLDAFNGRFEEYRRLDDEILPLAVENTNVKAQRLSFGPAQEAAEAFRVALDRAVMTGDSKESWRSQALAARALSAVRRVQVLQAPHIAEANLTVMTRMEQEMTASEAEARSTVRQLTAVLPASHAAPLADAVAALDRFAETGRQIVALSRRNSDVHSLALSLGRKRTVVAECETQLRALDQSLASHAFTATR